MATSDVTFELDVEFKDRRTWRMSRRGDKASMEHSPKRSWQLKAVPKELAALMQACGMQPLLRVEVGSERHVLVSGGVRQGALGTVVPFCVCLVRPSELQTPYERFVLSDKRANFGARLELAAPLDLTQCERRITLKIKYTPPQDG